MEEVIRLLEQEIKDEQQIIGQDIDMRHYHLGCLDTLQIIKARLEAAQQILGK
jgi:hypothetical protein